MRTVFVGVVACFCVCLWAQNAQPTAPSLPQPAQDTQAPHTVMTDTTSPAASADPLLDAAPLPQGTVALIGGTARKVDRVRNRIQVQPFGGAKALSVAFDERTHIYRDGRETTILAVKPGDRVYLDTQTVGTGVFARNVRVKTNSAPAEAAGQILGVDAARGSVEMVDSMTGQTVSFRLTPRTLLRGAKGSASTADLRAGTVISVVISAAAADAGEAREVNVLAVPGMSFVFAGRITFIDVRIGTVAVDNDADGKNYQLQVDMTKGANLEGLRVGSQIAANAVFDGHQYRVQNFSVTAPPVATEQ